jgi:hypothetical protein
MRPVRTVLIMDRDFPFQQSICSRLAESEIETVLANYFNTGRYSFECYNIDAVVFNPQLECSAEAAFCFLEFLRQRGFVGAVIAIDTPQAWRRALEERNANCDFRKAELEALSIYLQNLEVADVTN